MKRDDDQELWDLLGQAAERRISPFFARNVLREIRKPGDWATLRRWLNLRRLIPAAGMAGALTVVAGVLLSGLAQYAVRAGYDNDIAVLLGFEVQLVTAFVPYAIVGAVAGALGGALRRGVARRSR